MKKLALKLNTQKTKIMASDPITSWQIDEETVRDFIFGVMLLLHIHLLAHYFHIFWRDFYTPLEMGDVANSIT